MTVVFSQFLVPLPKFYGNPFVNSSLFKYMKSMKSSSGLCYNINKLTYLPIHHNSVEIPVTW